MVKQESILLKSLSYAPLLGRLLALPTSNRLGWKDLAGKAWLERLGWKDLAGKTWLERLGWKDLPGTSSLAYYKNL